MSEYNEVPLEEPPERVDVNDLHEPIIREFDEPADGFEPVPTWMLVVFGLTLFWGGYYLATNHANWSGDRLDAFGVSAPPAVPQLGFDTPEKLKLAGKGVYQANCARCHQDDGQGVAMKWPALRGSALVTGADVAKLVRVPLYGINDQCPKQTLRDDAVAAVLTFTRQEWGNNAPAVFPNDVAAERK